MTTSDSSQESIVVQSAPPSKIKLSDQPARLLIADTEEPATDELERNLTALGHTLIGPAPNADEAIELCRTDRVDMALVGIRLPDRDGAEAAEVIFRSMGIPVVIITAHADAKDISAGAQSGVFGYLIKPVSREQLRASIAVAWARFRDHTAQHSEVQELQRRLEERKFIEQAKWIIVKRKGISEPDAMRLLQKQARNNRRPLAEVARSILENESLFGVD
ncbi:MAG: ANTAR domain-containing response regulator [Phycisphaerales bacterium]|nr:ANTAR domain-containing protein [Planctomycetota bacterium]MCZ6542947.1 ANTAR domain-containing protein [Planctomycetota bacterium]MCZ6850846.1 ANTAR domain-containing protein [Planctomycetota bacterium]